MNIFSSIGLLIDIIGVIIIFYFGLPSKIADSSDSIALEESDDNVLNRKSKNIKVKILAHLGLTFLLIGFILQLIGTNINYLKGVDFIGK